jgi:hypothetical protein
VNVDGDKVMTEVAHKQLCYFPFTPRLKWLFISERTTRHMRKVLNSFDADFTSDVRNVHIRLAIDGFSPFNTNATPYSCWPIFAILYNLLPSLCMKYESMFLCLILLGLEHPGPCLNVILKPLIQELKQLYVGVKVYDKHKFNLLATYL